MTLISLIIPVFNNEFTLDELYKRVVLSFNKLKLGYEIVFVDDASVDGSFARLKELGETDPRVKIIRLKQNIGQSLAVFRALDSCCGDIIAVIDADLQYSPEEIGRLLDKIGLGFDVVAGWRKDRKDAYFFRILPSAFVNAMARFKLNKEFNDIGCFFVAFKKDIAAQLKRRGRQARFLKPLLINIAPSFCEVEVSHHVRKRGRSQFSFVRMVGMCFDFMFNFSADLQN